MKVSTPSLTRRGHHLVVVPLAIFFVSATCATAVGGVLSRRFWGTTTTTSRTKTPRRDEGVVEATIAYRVVDGSEHWLLARELEPGEVKEGGAVSQKSVRIRDARRADDRRMTLDEAGFELLSEATAMKTDDFYDPALVRDLYYPEIAAALKRALPGCAHAHVYSHAVRNAKRAGEEQNDDGLVQAYGLAAHVDAAPSEAAEIVAGMAKIAEHTSLKNTDSESHYFVGKKSLGRGRAVYLNAWRNIDVAPVEADPLALCDARSVRWPDDGVPFHLETPHYAVAQFHLDAAGADRHEWWYYPRMTRDELLIFKQWDSDPLRPARACFHSAFRYVEEEVDSSNRDNTGVLFSSNTPPRPPPPRRRRRRPPRVRQSIEARAVCFFPDAVPDSFPRFDDDDDDSYYR